MKYIKTFETKEYDDWMKYNTSSEIKFKVGDYVRDKNGEVYIIDDVDEFSVRIPYFLINIKDKTDHGWYIKDETNSGWWEDDELEKLEDWEVAAIKYNL
jgi:hypothetical protein